MRIQEFQKLIEDIYFQRDSARGRDRTFAWFVEEVGELSRALMRGKDSKNLREEFADVLAWLATLASLSGVSLEEVAGEKYGRGCPKCASKPCSCPGALPVPLSGNPQSAIRNPQFPRDPAPS